MASRSYNGFTAEQRTAGGNLQRRLLAAHPDKRKTRCDACGSTGRVHQHLEDYNDPIDGLIGLCVLCHVAVHERFKYPAMWARYVDDVADGKVFPHVADWRAGLRLICWSAAGFDQARTGAGRRGAGILDEIATGKWLCVGEMAGAEGRLW